MTMSKTRDAVLAAAQQLFAERGYANVHIAQISAEAGVSPAMVMKVGIRKQKLFEDATPPPAEPVLMPGLAREDIGREIVRQILRRRDMNATEPLLHSLLSTIDAPDPVAAREEFRDRYVGALRRIIDDRPNGLLENDDSPAGSAGNAEGQDAGSARGSQSQQRAEIVTALVIGLVYVVRGLHQLDDPLDTDAIIERYGGMIQSIIDADSL